MSATLVKALSRGRMPHMRTLSRIAFAFPVCVAVCPGLVKAGAFDVETTITAVSVNGGSDSANPGTSCVRIANPVVAACTGGVVAIQNNNKQLIAAALQAKATGSKVWFYYSDAGNFHCPGLVFTPCSVISIELR